MKIKTENKNVTSLIVPLLFVSNTKMSPLILILFNINWNKNKTRPNKQTSDRNWTAIQSQQTPKNTTAATSAGGEGNVL